MKNITEWEVMTPSGWQSFEGVKQVTKPYTLKLLLANKIELECSGGHQVFVKHLGTGEEGWLFADVVEPFLYAIATDGLGYQTVVSVETVNEEQCLYDLVNVDNGYEYYTNGIVSHNCAHIDNLKELWLGLYPTLSAGGRSIVFSSPNGKGNFFHELWMGADISEWEEGRVGSHSTKEGSNGFHAIKLPWNVHPDRDHRWFDNETRSMSTRAIAQELMCSFESSGYTYFNQTQIDYVKTCVQTPIATSGPSLNDQGLWTWRFPEPGKQSYLICADVARGDAQDYSAFHVIDTTCSEVVAEYFGKIPTDEFGVWLSQIGKLYNSALIILEKNTFGVATGNKLRDLKYPNLYFEPDIAEKIPFLSEEEKKKLIPGHTTTTSSREELLTKLEEVIRNHKLVIYSSRFVEQMEHFVFNGKRGQALKNKSDDLIMSLSIGLVAFEPCGNHGLDVPNPTQDAASWNAAWLLAVKLTRQSDAGNSSNNNKSTNTTNHPWTQTEGFAVNQLIRKEFGWLFR